MKKTNNTFKTILLITAILFSISTFAQAPAKMSYQAVIRDATNNLVINQNVGIQISILQTSASGLAVYIETHLTTTNANGLASVEIGNGTVVSGNLSTINWGTDAYFIKTETDPNGGTTYSISATNQLLSVPYALSTDKASNMELKDLTDVSGTPTSGQVLKWDGTAWKPQNDLTAGTGGGSYSGGSGITISGTNVITADLGTDISTAELQNNAVTSAKIASNAVTSTEIANNAVNTAQLANDAVTAPKIDDMGATSGQVMQYNGSSWAPATPTTGSIYTAGSGVSISGSNVITSTLGTDISTTEIQNNAVTTAKIATNAVTSTEIANDAVTAPKIDDMGASSGQVLKWSGSSWAPAADNTGVSSLDEIRDADNDTKIEVEKSTDEDIIRFKLGGIERWAMDGPRLVPIRSGSSIFIGENTGLNDDLFNNNNVFIGNNAGKANTTGTENIAVGRYALFSNTTGDDNIANGDNALSDNTTGNKNIAIGRSALTSNTTGSDNIALGESALFLNTTGANNIANGYRALLRNTTGGQNIANGRDALLDNTTGNFNLAHGANALGNNSTGGSNIAIGYSAGDNNRTGGALSLVGHTADVNDTNYTLSGAFGAYASITASYQYRIGSSIGTSSIGGRVAWTTVSDGRFKTNVQENVAGLAFIQQLRPVTYTLDDKKIEAFIGLDKPEDAEEITNSNEIFSGFIAQEVEATAEKFGYDFHGVDKPKNEKDYYGLRYAEFVVPLVKAVQELNVMVNEKDEMINDLQRQIDELKTLMMTK